MLPRPAMHSRLTWNSASAEPNCRRTLRWSLTCSMLAWAAPSEQEAGHTQQKHVLVEGLDTQSKTSCVSGGAGHTEQKHVSVEGLDTQSKNTMCDMQQKHPVSLDRVDTQSKTRQWRRCTHTSKTCVSGVGGHTHQKHHVSVEGVDTCSSNIMIHWRGVHTQQKHHDSLEGWRHTSKTS